MEYGTVWALAALALGEITVLAAFGLVTFVLMIVTWPLLFFLKSIYNLILGYD